jgi:tetratricopeptide (TPR) repeat protein
MFSAYNRRMRVAGWGTGLVVVLLLFFLQLSLTGQATKSNAGSAVAEGQRGMSLAEAGHCAEALPLLKRAIRVAKDPETQKKIGLTGLHCAMTHGQSYEALPFLQSLIASFPNDPEVLYSATHAFSDLSLATSQTLAREAPFSYQVHLLNAEALELEGKWEEAAGEYRKILEINPMLPGVHARLGRALLASPQPSPEAVAQAKRNFEQELEINPNDASSEYVLGELERTGNDNGGAIRHYTRATQLDAGFAEAYLGLGMALVSDKRFADAVPPLEKYEKFAPDSPTGHYQLALAYAGAGRRDDANREAALQRETAANLEKVKRRVAEGMEQQRSGAPPSGGPQ